MSDFNIILHPMPRCSKYCALFMLYQIPNCLSIFSHACYTPHPPHQTCKTQFYIRMHIVQKNMEFFKIWALWFLFIKFENVGEQSSVMPSIFVVCCLCIYICCLVFVFSSNLEEILEDFFTVLRWGKLKVCHCLMKVWMHMLLGMYSIYSCTFIQEVSGTRPFHLQYYSLNLK